MIIYSKFYFIKISFFFNFLIILISSCITTKGVQKTEESNKPAETDRTYPKFWFDFGAVRF